MFTPVKLKSYRETDKGTDIIIHVPDQKLGRVLTDKSIKTAELRLDDGRTISSDQRKKAYATINDIALYTGYQSFPQFRARYLSFLEIVFLKIGDKCKEVKTFCDATSIRQMPSPVQINGNKP